MSFRSLLAAGLCLAALSGCANRQAIHTGSVKTAYAYGMEGEQPLAASATINPTASRRRRGAARTGLASNISNLRRAQS